MATIIKGENPRKQWTVKYRDDQRKQRERSFATKTEALDFKITVEHGQRSQLFVDPKAGRVDFCGYAARWIDGLDRAPGTRASYRSILNAQIAPVVAGRSLADVATNRELVWSLVTGMDTVSGRKAACLGVIMSVCREAVRARKIPSHNLDGLKISKDGEQPAEIIPATSEQLAKLADGLRPDLHLLVWIMRGCGLRISEALAVNLKGFRTNGRTVLRVSEQVRTDGTLGPLKARKRGEYRDVPVPRWLWAMVQDHVSEFGTDSGYLFGSNGKRVRYGDINDRFNRSVLNAGLPEDFTTHHLRHLYVSTLLSKDVPISDVATWVGHRDIRITHAVYGHLLPDSWTRGTEALESLSPE